MGCASEPPSDRLKSLYEEFLPAPDFRRAQGRKHTIASVLSIVTVANLSGFETGIAAAQFARALSQTELKSCLPENPPPISDQPDIPDFVTDGALHILALFPSC